MRVKFINPLFEISEQSTLYHRSMKKMEVGEIIKPKKIKGTHWLEKNIFESVLEYFRQKKFPDRPSRFNSIYCSIIPRTRFKDKGYLYVVKPIGNMLMTNSKFIDRMSRSFDDRILDLPMEYTLELRKEIEKNPEKGLQFLSYMDAEMYWEGITGGNKEDIEVLCESAIVEEIIGRKEGELINGDKVEVKENNKVFVNTSIYFKKEDIKRFKENDREIVNYINNFKSLYINPEEKLLEYSGEWGGGNLNLSGYLKKGVRLKAAYVTSSMRDEKEDRPRYKYTRIIFEPYINNKLYKQTSENLILKFRMEYFYIYSKEIKNIANYLKII